MNLIVDGYSVLHHHPAWRKLIHAGQLERARDVLLEALDRLADRTGDSITVVFDGPARARPEPPAPRHLGVAQVMFAKAPMDADAVIERLVHKKQGATDLYVVTEDRVLSQMVLGMGAVAVRTERLLEWMSESWE